MLAILGRFSLAFGLNGVSLAYGAPQMPHYISLAEAFAEWSRVSTTSA
jgi:hypothetical protein